MRTTVFFFLLSCFTLLLPLSHGAATATATGVKTSSFQDTSTKAVANVVAHKEASWFPGHIPPFPFGNYYPFPHPHFEHHPSYPNPTPPSVPRSPTSEPSAPGPPPPPPPPPLMPPAEPELPQPYPPPLPDPGTRLGGTTPGPPLISGSPAVHGGTPSWPRPGSAALPPSLPYGLPYWLHPRLFPRWPRARSFAAHRCFPFLRWPVPGWSAAYPGPVPIVSHWPFPVSNQPPIHHLPPVQRP